MAEQANDAMSEVTEINPFPEAIAENSWYWGCADAALGQKGIDYSSLHSGIGRVEDERAHDARILAGLDMAFRAGLWERAWIESCLGEIPREHVRTLKAAFTPVGWPWDAGAEKRKSLTAHWRCKNRSCEWTTSQPAKKERPRACGVCGGKVVSDDDYKSRSQWETDLRRSLWLIPYAYWGEQSRKDSKNEEDKRFPTHAVCLVELALQSGCVRRAALDEPDWETKDNLVGGLPRSDQLEFLRQKAVDSYAGNSDGRGLRANKVLATIRSTTGTILMPALRAYAQARTRWYQDTYPASVKARDGQRKARGSEATHTMECTAYSRGWSGPEEKWDRLSTYVSTEERIVIDRDSQRGDVWGETIRARALRRVARLQAVSNA